MNVETLSRVFEPFFTTKESGKGTGLGLPSAFAMIKQSRGQVSVRSQPLEGTTFEIFLPTIERKAETLIATAGSSQLKAGSAMAAC